MEQAHQDHQEKYLKNQNKLKRYSRYTHFKEADENIGLGVNKHENCQESAETSIENCRSHLSESLLHSLVTGTCTRTKQNSGKTDSRH